MRDMDQGLTDLLSKLLIVAIILNVLALIAFAGYTVYADSQRRRDQNSTKNV